MGTLRNFSLSFVEKDGPSSVIALYPTIQTGVRGGGSATQQFLQETYWVLANSKGKGDHHLLMGGLDLGSWSQTNYWAFKH